MNKRQIEKWLIKHHIKNYIINDNLTVDVDGNVNLYAIRLTALPFRFGKVTGYFDCAVNKLTSLKNCPYYVGCDFYCFKNQLTSLQYCPYYVGYKFYAHYNKLTSVKELLEIHMGGDIVVDDNMEQTSEYKLLMKLNNLKSQ
jgi:hypothetical protein